MNLSPSNRVIVLSLAGIVALGGCATAGNEKMKDQTQASIAAQITEGKTKDEVKSALGNATSVSFTDSGKEIWTYKHMRASPKAVNFIPIVNWFARGADVKTKEVVILFEGNVVTKYTMRETDDQVKQGSAQ